MRPAWLARMLVWAGVLLFFYWGFKNNSQGVAFAVGLMLGAGTLVYGDRPRPVLLILVLSLLVGAIELIHPELKRGSTASPEGYLLGYFIGLLSPYIAWRLKAGSPPPPGEGSG